jgi:Uri superfamily endonuclease
LPVCVDGLVVGRLGRFDFVDGFYAYVGSAFGPGGVQARTGRHLTPDTKKKWNVDYLKPFTEPVAVWWTTDPVKWECRWAELVGKLNGAFVPAPRFGTGSDCRGCRAHLYGFRRRPSFAEFASSVAARLDGHGLVCRSLVRNAGGRLIEGVTHA